MKNLPQKIITILANFRNIPEIRSKQNEVIMRLCSLSSQLDEYKILAGINVANTNKQLTPEIIKNINLSEFKVFSQWGDDGIIQFLVNYLDIDNKIFIEFGVENYREANTRFLLINNNWSGLVMDGSQTNIDQIKQDDIYWKYDLKCQAAFITKENINELISSNNIKGQIGLLHIDIDGNDYWVWKEIEDLSPVIVIVEYNSVFGIDHPWTVPYDKNFYRTEKHCSNLYFGSSLLSLCDLASEKGYDFIGSNSNGNNAYFIRKDKMKELKAVKPKDGYVVSKFRECRDANGLLAYTSGIDRIKTIEGMPVYNTRTNKLEKIKI